MLAKVASRALGEISPKAFFCLRIWNATGEAWFDGLRLESIGHVEKK